MRQLALAPSLDVGRIAYGCGNLGGSWDERPIDGDVRAKAARAVRAALDAGIDCFDIADIYCRGKSETVLADALASLGVARDRVAIQSKCGIRFAGDPPGTTARYDFSRVHILRSTEAILARLRTDRLEVLLLHRPDALVEPAEVASAFDELHASGKVRWFGVSNHTPAQVELLRRHVRQPLVANQVQLGLAHRRLIDAGVDFNLAETPGGTAGTLDWCRLHGVLVQAWSPMGGGAALGDAARAPALASAVDAVARRHGVPREAVPIAWLLRHPAGIMPIVGSLDPARIAALCAADRVELSREEWYALYEAARGRPVP